LKCVININTSTATIQLHYMLHIYEEGTRDKKSIPTISTRSRLDEQ